MSLSQIRTLLLLVLICVFVFPLAASAEDALALMVTPTIDCDHVTFSIELNGGAEPYTLYFDYGDGKPLPSATLMPAL